MIRIVNVALVLLMLLGAGVTYQMKHTAEQVADKVAKLNTDIGREKEAIAMLKAEWSVLTHPARLQSVIAKYLEHFRLEPFAASQVALIDEIPMRPEPPAEPPKPTAVAEAAAAAALQ